MRHLNLKVEKLEERIAPGGVKMGNHGSRSNNSRSNRSRSHNSRSNRSKSYSR
jgi:hypothetical protein